MMKNKKGFTLVELLAVIVILAVILVIAIPRIIDVIDSSKLSSFESSARMIISDAEKQYAINKVNGIEEELSCENTSKLNNNEYSNCEITFDSEGLASIELTGSGKFDELKCKGSSTTLVCWAVLLTGEACFTFNSETINSEETYFKNYADNWYGNVATIIEYTQYRHPNCQIILWSPLPYTSDSQRESIATGMKTIADMYGCKFIDSGNCIGVGSRNKLKWLQDSIHGTTERNEKWGRYMVKEIQNYMFN